MTNRLNSELSARLPAQLAQLLPPDRLEQLRNPQALQAPEAAARLREAFAALGPQGTELFTQFMQALRESLAASITSLFAISAAAPALSFLTMLFMPEIPLRGMRRSSAGAAELSSSPEAPAGTVATQRGR
jgi:hypothetical protein